MLRLCWEVGPQGNKSKGEREKAGKGVGIKYPTSSGFTTKQQGAWPGDVFQRGFVECGGRAGAYLLSLIGNPPVHFQCVPCPPPGSRMLGSPDGMSPLEVERNATASPSPAGKELTP